MTQNIDYAENAIIREQRILDARMEYQQLLTSFQSLANMVWVGYGAFFTINTLLATALVFSYSTGASQFNPIFIKFLHILVPIIGAFISLVAIHTIREIKSLARLINSRGREIEEFLFVKTFHELKKYSEKPPVATTIGSMLFFLLWVGSLYGAF